MTVSMSPTTLEAWTDRGLRFAEWSLPRLTGATPSPPPVSADPLPRFADKLLAETSFLLRVARRTQRSLERDATLHRLFGVLQALARDDAVALSLMRHPQLAPIVSTAHAVLTANGFPDAAFEEIAARALADARFTTLHVEMQSAHASWLQQVRTGERKASGSVGATSSLRNPPHPIYAARVDSYVLSHDAMFFSDFGDVALDIDAATRDALLRSLDALVAQWLWEDDLDAMGEMIIARALVGGPPSTNVVVGLRVLDRAWVGEPPAIPGRRFDAAHHAGLVGAEADRYRMRHCYHPTYVAGILGCIARSHGGLDGSRQVQALRAPADADLLAELSAAFGAGEPATNPRHRPTLREGMALLGLSAERPARGSHLLKALDEDDLGAANALLLLADCLMIEACRTYDLTALAELLAAIPMLDLPPSPTFVTALRFVLDQRVSSDSFGARLALARSAARSSAADVVDAMERSMHMATDHLTSCWANTR
jgi:hypothetical protein